MSRSESDETPRSQNRRTAEDGSTNPVAAAVKSGGRGVRRLAKITALSITIVIAFYLTVAVNDSRQVPNIAIDHVSEMNAPIAATPLTERAWPLIREALSTIRSMVRLEGSGPEAGRPAVGDLTEAARAMLPSWRGDDPTPGEVDGLPSEDDVARFLSKAADARAMLLEASTRSSLGFELHAEGPVDPADRAFFGLGPRTPQALETGPMPANTLNGSLLEIQLPHLAPVREAARILDADARQSLHMSDGSRAIDDLAGILDLGRLIRRPPLLLNQLVGAALDQMVFQTILDGLAVTPEAFADEDLNRLERILVDLDEKRFVLDLEGERRFFGDIVQRLYTDDGEGDGRLTLSGIRSMNQIGLTAETAEPSVLEFISAPLFRRAVISRARANGIMDGLYDAYQAAAESPAWEIDVASMTTIEGQSIQETFADSGALRYFPLPLLVPSLEAAVMTGHAGRADRDLAIAVVGMERARRGLGEWPESMEDAGLSRIPIDPMDGSELGYAVRDGRPMFWSRGPDRDDDLGVAIIPRAGAPRWMPSDDAAGFAALWAYWGADTAAEPRLDGDLVLWRGRALQPDSSGS